MHSFHSLYSTHTALYSSPSPVSTNTPATGSSTARFRQGNTNASVHVHVHISNLAAQTGASLFTQLNAPPYWDQYEGGKGGWGGERGWVYNKTEGLSLDELIGAKSPFTHLIIEEDPSEKGVLGKKGWGVVKEVKALEGVRVQPSRLKDIIHSFAKSPSLANIGEKLREVVRIEKPGKLWILECTT
ncbi:hypothetical protein NMY22_g3599 [Coprinellus aureogranulatus]|nr:hypothetical protein NMY22_g3599 [Coprinellus aureogranulatus]